LLVFACVGILYACNKNNANNPGNSATSPTDLSTQSDDAAQVSNESDAVNDDANTALNSQVSIAGSSTASEQSGTTTVMGQEQPNGAGTDLSRLICDATITVDTASNPRTITITYDGTNCRGNRTRTGVVVISIPKGERWRDAGAWVSVAIENLKITRISDGKTIVLNGTRTITNVSGGLLVDLAILGTITHTVSGSLSITFDNGTRQWNVAKERVFTYNDGIVMTTTGTHTDSLGNTNVAEWGTTRFGVEFESLISEPKVFRQDCDFRLVSGQNTILTDIGLTGVITYGLDAEGDPTGCPGSGTYYLKAVWTNAKGITITKILPY
jgi:hypothetical protein